ncbi:MAG: hypothetical protein AAGE52_35130 [Myxococcota bacterium]
MRRLVFCMVLTACGGSDERVSLDAALDAATDIPSRDAAFDADRRCDFGEEVASLEVRNDRAERTEYARGAFPLPEGSLRQTQELALVDEEGCQIPAQFDALSRWDADPADEDAFLQWVQVGATLRAGTDARSLRVVTGARAAAPRIRFEDSVVDTGVARFALDDSGSLLERGDDTDALFDAVRLRLRLDGADVDEVSPDGPIEVIEGGPERVVLRQDGHFQGPTCNVRSDEGPLNYPAFGYTLVAAFVHGSAAVDLAFEFRNECGNGSFPPFDAETRAVERAGIEIRLAGGGSAWVQGRDLHRGDSVFVSQDTGGGSPWTRQSRVMVNDEEVERAQSIDTPAVGRGEGTRMSLLTMPFLRYREPQALEVEGDMARAWLVSETLDVGEAKGIWGAVRLAFGSNLESATEQARLERGLLLRPDPDTLARADVFTPLGPASTTTPAAIHYRGVLDRLHRGTREEQWRRYHVYGSQLWPDIPLEDLGNGDPSRGTTSPATMDAKLNYWNASGALLHEFFRSGDPAYAWDMALPASWLQAHAAYYNLGRRSHGTRNGLAVSSGGTGIGRWHRGDGGSDDYGYNLGLQLAYLVRPTVGLRDRFEAAGRTVLERYAPDGPRERFFTARDLSRQTTQHFEMLANCAQFVPGEAGNTCRERLHELVRELYEDNLRGGVVCTLDEPSGRCEMPQQFMINALMVPFFVRYLRTWPRRLPELRETLLAYATTYRRYGLSDPIDVDAAETFAARLACNLNADRSIADCELQSDSDGNTYMYRETRPQTLAALIQLEALAGDDCALSAAVDDPRLMPMLDSWAPEGAGFWKGASQMLQGVVYAAGLSERCARSE